jgi:hypothetical protein
MNNLPDHIKAHQARTIAEASSPKAHKTPIHESPNGTLIEAKPLTAEMIETEVEPFDNSNDMVIDLTTKKTVPANSLPKILPKVKRKYRART